MKNVEALVLASVLFIASISLVALSFYAIEKPISNRNYVKTNSWNVTGFFEKGEFLAFDLYAGGDWATGPLPSEEFSVYINISVVAPDGGMALFLCNYSGFLQISGSVSTLFLIPVGVDVISLNTSYLDVGYVGVIGEAESYALFGETKMDGNFSVVVDRESVTDFFFLSDDPPRKLNLLGYRREFPYSFLLPLSWFFVVCGGIVIGFVVKRKWVARRRRVAGSRLSSRSNRKKN